MEACATSHFWGRFAQALGHDVRLIPPIYVKPFVKRQKNDAADAAAIAEAAVRPNLHYVAVKSAEHQARAVAFRTYQSFVGQRTQLINALRGQPLQIGQSRDINLRAANLNWAQMTGSTIQPGIETTMRDGPSTLRKRPIARSSTRRTRIFCPK